MPKSFHEYVENREISKLAEFFVENNIDTKEFVDCVLHLYKSPKFLRESQDFVNEDEFLDYVFVETANRFFGGIRNVLGAGARRIGQDVRNVAGTVAAPFNYVGRRIGQAANAVGGYIGNQVDAARQEVGQRMAGAKRAYNIGYVKNAKNDLMRLQKNLSQLGVNQDIIQRAFKVLQYTINNIENPKLMEKLNNPSNRGSSTPSPAATPTPAPAGTPADSNGYDSAPEPLKTVATNYGKPGFTPRAFG